MLSTDFAYFISFLIFSFFAYKYGHKILRKTLDQKIQTIADSLTQGNIEKEKAQMALSAVKNELHTLEGALKEQMVGIEERIAEFQEKQRKQLIDLLLEREKYHQTLLDNERKQNIQNFKKELVSVVMKEIQISFAKNPELQLAFQKTSISLLEEVFYSES